MKIANNLDIIPIFDTLGGTSINKYKGDLNLVDISRVGDKIKLNYFGRVIQKLEMIVRILLNKKVSVIYLNKNTVHRITVNRIAAEQFEITNLLYNAECETKIYNQELINPNFEKWKLN